MLTTTLRHQTANNIDFIMQVVHIKMYLIDAIFHTKEVQTHTSFWFSCMKMQLNIDSLTLHSVKNGNACVRFVRDLISHELCSLFITRSSCEWLMLCSFVLKPKRVEYNWRDCFIFLFKC